MAGDDVFLLSHQHPVVFGGTETFTFHHRGKKDTVNLLLMHLGTQPIVSLIMLRCEEQICVDASAGGRRANVAG